MAGSLKSLIASGTKLWIDSVDPDLVARDARAGATGATSNPVIISDLLRSGRFDDQIRSLTETGKSDDDIAWLLTNELVSQAEQVFLPVWERTRGNDGYVSFEVNPLLEDEDLGPPLPQRIEAYVELGRRWALGHPNRMIKVPATEAGLAALSPLAAAGITLNVTLVFSSRQYRAARDAVWHGARQRASLDRFKSVYSIFVSRIDIYTEQHAQRLSPQSQGQVGILNAKRIWRENQAFWQSHPTPLQQEIIFASTGTKKPVDAPWKYVAAFAGSDIETNPPVTNEAADASGLEFTRQVDQLPPPDVQAEIDRCVDFQHLEDTLMREGIRKFAEPQKALLAQIASKRAALRVH